MVIEESGMQFEFPDNRTTVKFDEELFYKNCFNYSSHYFSNYNWKKVVKLPVNTILKVECLP